MTTRLLIRAAGFALAILMLSSCATPAVGPHPLMLCSQVGPNLMACVDSDAYKKIQNQPADEPLQPAPQRGPAIDPRRGA